MDNLPVAVLRQRKDTTLVKTYEHGFPVGSKANLATVSYTIFPHLPFVLYQMIIDCSVMIVQSGDAKYFISNHLSFKVMYHNDPKIDAARIVGFEVTPSR